MVALIFMLMASVSASDVSDMSDLALDNQSGNLSLEDSNLEINAGGEENLSKDISDSRILADSGSSSNSSLDSSSGSSSNSSSGSSSNSSSGSSSSSDSLAAKNETALVSSSSKVSYGNSFNVTLMDKNTNSSLSNKSLTLTFNNKTYAKTTDETGQVYFIMNRKAGNYSISVSFDGDDSYENVSESFSFTVVKAATAISNSGSSVVKGKSYSLSLKDAGGNVLANKTVSIVYGGKTYKKTTNAKGVVSLKISSAVGKTYKMTYKFAGDNYYAASSGSVSIKVKLGTSLTASASSVIKGKAYSVRLKDANKKALASKKIVFTFNGKSYNKTTNSKGIASLKINADANNTYNLSCSYAGSSYYGSSSSGIVSLFVKIPTSLSNSGSSIVKGKVYSLSLKDNKGSVLSNKTVSIVYRGKTYKKTTNAKGIAGITINSAAGKSYKISYKFAGDSLYGASSGSASIKVKLGTSLTGSSSSIVAGKTYSVRLKDANKKALASKKIVFTFNGKTYNKTTNSKGLASLKINPSKAGTYSFSYKYGGSSYYGSSSSGNLNLTVRLSSKFSNSGTSIMNGSDYSISLTDGSGNPLGSKNITVTFNGKTYNETTNSSGAVSFNVNVTSPKSYNLTYKFAGDSEYASASGSLSLNVKSDKVFSISQIISAATSLRTYVEKNARVPATVSVNGVKVNLSGFSYLMAKALISINSNKTSGYIGLINISSNYSNNGSKSINGNLYKANYTLLAKNLISYADENNEIPNYINTSLGLLSPNLYTFGLSKALQYYGAKKVLPSYLILSSSDFSDANVTKKGNLSQYMSGLNQIASLSSSELAKYLESSGHDAVTTAIKNLAISLTAGKTSTWSKALAIFNYVRDNISYSYYANSQKGAAKTLSTKSGNCCDKSNLIVALCRAANITARFSHGKGCTFSSGLVTGHVWAQIYIGGIWYSADATSSRNSLGNIKNWNINSFSNLKQYDHLPF